MYGRECEYVSLTSDTSEADLKARRELRKASGLDVDESKLSVVWFDQAVVRAATHGRTLVLEGLEKAERNVLPILNNLLENREMQLEDGRFLVSPSRFDDIQHTYDPRKVSLVRVHQDFRVIAVGVPSPPFPGNPLDPPLRSRFQARHIGRIPVEELLFVLRRTYAPNVPRSKIELLVSTFEAIWALGDDQAGTAGQEAQALAFSSLCFPSEHALVSAAQLLQAFPLLDIKDVLHRIYPSHRSTGLLEGEALTLVCEVLGPSAGHPLPKAQALCIDNVVAKDRLVDVTLSYGTGRATTISLPGSNLVDLRRLEELHGSAECMHVVASMIQSASLGKDLCIIGGRGEGKSYIAHHFAACLGYSQVETLFLFEDMTARDLLQRRSTNAAGESVWQPTPLTNAIRFGRLCILDGLDRLQAGTIATLVRLVQDREISLYDGTQFISQRRWRYLTKQRGISERHLHDRGVFPIHPSFRILGVACPSDR